MTDNNPINQKAHCCFIPQKNQAKAKRPGANVTVLSCKHAAEWQITFGGGVDDYTQSCTKHVGNLLNDAPEFVIFHIEK